MKTAKLATLMAAHMAAFFSNTADAAYEKREDATIQQVAEAVEKIGTTFDEYRKVNDARLKAAEEGKSTVEFEAKLAKMDAQFDALTTQMDEVRSKNETLETRLARPGQNGGDGKQEIREAVEYRNAWMDFMRDPKDQAKEQRMRAAGAKLEARDAADGREVRATFVTTGTNTAGGYALPKEVERTIMRLGTELTPMRQIATVRQVGTPDYHELVDVGGAGFEWVGEGDTRNETNSPDMASINPTFGMLSARPKATEESIQDLFFDVEDWLTGSVRETFAVAENQAFVAGNGVKKPTGFLAGPAPVATGDSTRPFGTLQYIPSGQAAALPTTGDVFLDMIYSIRARYRTNARWVTSRAGLAAMRKYKDTTGAYMWQPALTAGQPATFMGYPITEMEDMPAVAANSFPIAFGDFREGYLIADRVGIRITRDEITQPGFVKFYIRKRVGGIVRNSQAIRVMKIATA